MKRISEKRNELAQLEAELKEVQSSDLDYLPNYGYSSKEEIIQLIGEDIIAVKSEMMDIWEYSDEELERERSQLCMSLGISRYC